MKHIIFILPVAVFIAACNPMAAEPSTPRPAVTRGVTIVNKIPTATNFPKAGTPTPAPPTATPRPTSTQVPATAMFDDNTLADLMAGTISSAGVDAEVIIVDNQATGGKRRAEITITSDYNIEDSELLLKLFVLEVGNALRTIRAFSEGDMHADLDSAYMIVNDKQGQQLGTVSAPMTEIVSFLDGKTSVNEALNKLTLTGVFETFREN